jgi:transcriptional regulator with GAF, ATPase, and Fis domain
MMEMGRGIVWATPKLRELLLFEPDEELPFDRFVAAVHPDDCDRVRMLVLKSLEGQEALNMEYRIVQPDGMIRWISSRGNPPSVGSGLTERLTGVSVDVTESKQMEQELRERLNEIERLKLQLEKENVYLREEIKTGKGFQKIVGNSEALQYVFFRVQQVAPTDATVLVLGETGTGKGMVAHAIHEMSARKDRPMITVNCAALPVNLIESELFGREKGAFTGAHAKQVGRFEVANGGTIFLDEIGEMPLELQAKLLRVLQDGEFERLGSPRTIKVDVRVIASTSRDLKAEVHDNRFREDLFYRLNVFPISMPPLRMRADDISELVGHFVDKYARKIGRQIKTVPKSMMKSLQGYSWPGNVRELEHVIERAVITSAGPVLRLADRFEGEPVEAKEDLLKDLVAVEREHILKVLQKTRWKIDGVGGAASLLGLHPSTLRFRIKKLGIHRP